MGGLVAPGETAGAEEEDPVESGREGTAVREEEEEPLLLVPEAVTLTEGSEPSFLPVEPRLFFCSLEERFVFDDEDDEDDGSSPSSLSEGIFTVFAVSSPEDVLEAETLLEESTCAEAEAFPFDTTATAAGTGTGADADADAGARAV